MEAVIIDIGSNSIRYLRGEVRSGCVYTQERLLETTRLAANIDQSGRLCEESILRSLDALESFTHRARRAGLYIFAYATSAVRDALNRREFLLRIGERAGIVVDVLSTRREANLALLGATCGHGGLIDIGGGSIQIVDRHHGVSIPAGCVRLKDFILAEGLAEAPLEEQRRAVSGRVTSLLGDARFDEQEVTGVGGSITTLMALKLGLTEYRSGAVQGERLSLAALGELLAWLFALGAKRSEHPLLKARHDVILYGGMALETILNRLKMDSVRVSDADGLEGYLIELEEIENSYP
ncbi:MAG: hypothetical protein AAGU74_10580 [Bacillota bacterium]